MEKNNWPEIRTALSLLASKEPASGNALLVAPNGLYGKSFVVPKTIVHKYDKWFVKGSVTTWSSTWIAIAIFIVLKIFIRQFHGMERAGLVASVFAIAIIWEYAFYRFRLKSFLRSFPEATVSGSRMKGWWRKKVLIVAVSPVANVWLLSCWAAFGMAIIGWGGIRVVSGELGSLEFFGLLLPMSAIFFGLPICTMNAHTDYRHEQAMPLTQENLLNLWR